MRLAPRRVGVQAVEEDVWVGGVQAERALVESGGPDSVKNMSAWQTASKAGVPCCPVAVPELDG